MQASGSRRVNYEMIHKPGIGQHRFRRRRARLDRTIGEQKYIMLRVSFAHQVKARQSNYKVADAAHSEDQNFFWVGQLFRPRRSDN
jgi:hypothetical protein